MKLTKPEVLEIIYLAVDEFNEMQEEDERLERSPGALLHDENDGGLDDVGLVNFLMTLDDILDQAQETVGIALNINHTLENRETILKTLDTLAQHLLDLQNQVLTKD